MIRKRERYGSRVIYPAGARDINRIAEALAKDACKRSVKIADLVYSKKLDVFVAVYPWEKEK